MIPRKRSGPLLTDSTDTFKSAHFLCQQVHLPRLSIDASPRSNLLTKFAKMADTIFSPFSIQVSLPILKSSDAEIEEKEPLTVRPSTSRSRIRRIMYPHKHLGIATKRVQRIFGSLNAQRDRPPASRGGSTKLSS